jgi:hypothetical protein
MNKVWMVLILAVSAPLIYSRLTASETPQSSFHPNGMTILVGAIVCPDSAHARSEFHEGIQGGQIAEQIVQSGNSEYEKVQALSEVQKTHWADFSSDGCSELEGEVPVYIQSEDVTGVATITAQLPDDTLLHGITYTSEIQSEAGRKGGQ